MAFRRIAIGLALFSVDGSSLLQAERNSTHSCGGETRSNWGPGAIWGFPQMVVPPKWMLHSGKHHSNRWFRGTPISGNLHIRFNILNKNEVTEVTETNPRKKHTWSNQTAWCPSILLTNISDHIVLLGPSLPFAPVEPSITQYMALSLMIECPGKKRKSITTVHLSTW